MGISSNQARFLALTARQVDLEFRVQQICQRRIRLASELENVATSYNNSISNRKMFTMNTSNSGISNLSIAGINALKDTNGKNYKLVGQDATATPAFSSDISFTNSGGTAFTIGGATTGGTDKSVSFSSLGLAAGATQSEALDAAIRNGVLSIAMQSDEFTQSITAVGDGTAATATGSYELKDWRTLPAIADELYRGDDVDATNKYDTTISEINAQDKKLQLEQTSQEVEYKAITSEKEAVKKILDTNAQSSFKYFS